MFTLAADGSPLGHVLDIVLWEVNGTPIITMHMVTLLLATVLFLCLMYLAAQAITTGPESEGFDRYRTKSRIGQLVEVLVLGLRDNMIEPILGHYTNKYMPFLMSLFFFILINNLLGLVPLLDINHLFGHFVLGDGHWAWFGGTATGNLAVTGGLALVAFVVIQMHAFKDLGVGGWCHHLLGGAPAYLAPLMIPIELASTFIKPVALALRLFANMLGGHTLMATLALFGAMAYSGTENWWIAGGISVVSAAGGFAITFLEIFVAFLQAFIFMFLTCVFIGQMTHHHDHDDEHGAEAASHQDYDPEVAHA